MQPELFEFYGCIIVSDTYYYLYLQVYYFYKEMEYQITMQNEILNEQFKQIVLNQLKDNNPPITKETYNRLLAEGFDEEKTIELLSYAVSNAVYNSLKNERPFDENELAKMMKQLPKMPWEE
jgi:hypothetical protein